MKIGIKIRNREEKLAALIYLSAVSDLPVSPTVWSDTIRHQGINSYPIVYISASLGAISSNANGCSTHGLLDLIVPFQEMTEHQFVK